jgi:isoleucyl-tRNA synthetase
MSKVFKEHKGLNLPEKATDILDFWKNNDIFSKSIETRKDGEPFIFFEGPPSANGLPGIHHAMGRTIKDIFCRYKTQKGFLVNRKAGWDTHGLPVELGTEKELGITKEDIGSKITIAAYNEACKKTVMRYTDVWNDLTEKLGYWVDMNDPYITYKPKYMESVWWLLQQIYNKNLMYKGYTIQPYSPKAGTGLSSHEVNQPGSYRDVTDTTVVAQFRSNDKGTNNVAKAFGLCSPPLEGLGEVYFLAWTTTPWTLPSNTSLTVGPKIDYVLIKTFNQYTFEPVNVILAKNLVGKIFDKKFFQTNSEEDFLSFSSVPPSGVRGLPFKTIAECKGTDLVGIKYEQLLPYALPYQNPENAFRVILGDFVTTEDGTGIVHTAPTFGADDAKVAKEATPEVPPMLVLDENENPVPLVDLQGKFLENLGELSGKFVKNEYYDEGKAPEKSVDVEIAIKLKEENKAFKVEKYVHSYPHCWRTDKPILYYPLDSWFIKISEIKEKMFQLNETINWKPKATGEGRFGNWLKTANDWNLSRSRYWGIPLPIWRTEDKTEEYCIGSVEELYDKIEASVAAGLMTENIYQKFEKGNLSDENYEHIDLHKNIVDSIVLVSPSGKPMYRESDLIDVWFDSGAMPYAQWHYPFAAQFKDGSEPPAADFIAEGVDQTRGWFYTLHAISSLVFDKIIYKNVVSNGLVLDKNGQKMSKRLGNTVDPFTTMTQHGPDATRWYMIANANPWDNLKFDEEGIIEVRRKFFGTLYNTYSFFALYANIDGFNYSEAEIPLAERPEIDRWILSELHTLIKNTDEYYNDYEPTKVARAISDFVQENLSNWYVRLCRRRFWKGEYAQDKIAAYQTLHTCLTTVAKLSAPIAPFYMDRLYQDLTANCMVSKQESVHLTYYPIFVEKFVDKSLERKMMQAQTVSSLVLSLRKKEMIKVRQPLQKVLIPILNSTFKEEIEAVSDLIKAEVNVKEIELLTDTSGILIKQIKPNFKTLGPKFGKDMGLISKEIQSFDADKITQIEKEEKLILIIQEKEIILTLEDVEIISQDIPGWLVASDKGITVALDITLTPELIEEGIAREMINRIQNIRKDSGFEVTDKIEVEILKNEVLEKAIKANEEYIKLETLTKNIKFVEDIENGIEIEFDSIISKIKITN